MCLIITFIAGIISLIVWLIDKNSTKTKTGFLVLMYFGASLMWCVDGIFAIFENEPFFDMSLNDTYLGLTVVGFGLLLYFIYRLVSKFKSTV